MRRTVAAVAVSLSFAPFGACRLLRDAQLNAVTERVGQISGVRLLEASSWPDNLFEEQRVALCLEIHDQGVVTVTGVRIEAFQGTRPFYLSTIGTWSVTALEGNPSNAIIPLRLGPRGYSRVVFGIDINTFQEFVAHYQSIARAVETWPVCPQYAVRGNVGVARYDVSMPVNPRTSTYIQW